MTTSIYRTAMGTSGYLISQAGTSYRAEELRWEQEALCAQTDPEAFFPDKGGSPQAAKRLCLSCPVREQCLAHMLELHERPQGVWAGLSERAAQRAWREHRQSTNEAA